MTAFRYLCAPADARIYNRTHAPPGHSRGKSERLALSLLRRWPCVADEGVTTNFDVRGSIIGTYTENQIRLEPVLGSKVPMGRLPSSAVVL